MAEISQRGTPLHRAEISLGEWLCRVIESQDAGAVSERRAVLYAQGSADPDGMLEDSL